MKCVRLSGGFIYAVYVWIPFLPLFQDGARFLRAVAVHPRPKSDLTKTQSGTSTRQSSSTIVDPVHFIMRSAMTLPPHIMSS